MGSRESSKYRNLRRGLNFVSAGLLLVVIATLGWRYYAAHRAKEVGILSENIRREGDAWKVDFTARISGHEEAVFAAIQNIEFLHNDQVKAVRVVSRHGNKKIVDMDIAGPTGQAMTTELEFQYLPEENKITYHTVNNPMLETQAEYNFGDEGASTFIDYHETTHIQMQIPVPDGVIKQVIRGIFMSQLESLKQALKITTADKADPKDEEP